MTALRMTQAEVEAHRNRSRSWRAVLPGEPKGTANLIPGGHTLAAKKAKPKGMNKWEEAFARTLEYRKAVGEIVWWAYEPFRIRLADGAFYRPDFATVDLDGRTSIYEVKGHYREAARVRLKVACEKLPYPFYLVKRTKGEFRVVPL